MHKSLRGGQWDRWFSFFMRGGLEVSTREDGIVFYVVVVSCRIQWMMSLYICYVAFVCVCGM